MCKIVKEDKEEDDNDDYHLKEGRLLLHIPQTEDRDGAPDCLVLVILHLHPLILLLRPLLQDVVQLLLMLLLHVSLHPPVVALPLGRSGSPSGDDDPTVQALGLPEVIYRIRIKQAMGKVKFFLVFTFQFLM